MNEKREKEVAENVKKIRNAIYAKDVRGAIADSIDTFGENFKIVEGTTYATSKPLEEYIESGIYRFTGAHYPYYMLVIEKEDYLVQIKMHTSGIKYRYANLRHGEMWYKWKYILFDEVDTKNIKDKAVTEDKIADKAVTENKIKDKSITREKLGFDTFSEVENIKIDNVDDMPFDDLKTTGFYKISPPDGYRTYYLFVFASDVTTYQIYFRQGEILKRVAFYSGHQQQTWNKWKDISDAEDSSITTKKLVDKAVTRDKIADGAITANKLADEYYTKSEVVDLINKTITETLEKKY